MNLRPSGYEPDELPDCSTPQPIEIPALSLRFCQSPKARLGSFSGPVSRASPSKGPQSYPLRQGLQGLLPQRSTKLRGEVCRFLLIERLGGPADTEALAMPWLRDDVEVHMIDGLVGA